MMIIIVIVEITTIIWSVFLNILWFITISRNTKFRDYAVKHTFVKNSFLP